MPLPAPRSRRILDGLLALAVGLSLGGLSIEGHAAPGDDWSLERRKDDPAARRLVGLALPGRKIARQGYAVHADDDAPVGAVTSGSFAPTLDQSLAMALVRRDRVKQPLRVEIRGERVDARTVKLPFYTQPALRA